MPLFAILLLVQIYCAYHVISTNREKYWIFIIIIAPGLGCLIYFLTQILPDLGQTRTARSLKQEAVRKLDPSRELREARRAFDMVESVENRLRLADALMALGKWGEAEPHLKQTPMTPTC